MPALHLAFSQCRLDYVQVLLEFGADIKLTTTDNPPETVEDICKRMGFKEGLKFINNGFHIDNT
jgi:hypothetical protein